jgi:hypothetical protein
MALTFPFGSGRRRSQGAWPDELGAVYGDMPQANAVIVYISSGGHPVGAPGEGNRRRRAAWHARMRGHRQRMRSIGSRETPSRLSRMCDV